MTFTPGFIDLISFTDLNLNIETYISRALAKSPNAVMLNNETIMEKILDLRQENCDILQLTNGHDFINTLAKYFREIEGRQNISGDHLQASLRIAFSKDNFTSTRLYQQLNDWAFDNLTTLF